MITLVYGVLMTGPVLLVAVWGLLTYNSLVKKRHMVEEAWSGIDVQLQRRDNLIPKLVQTINTFTDHEFVARTDAAQSPTQPGNIKSVKATQESELGRSQVLRELLTEVKNHPDILSDQKYLELQTSLDNVETNIQQARRYYNGAARVYNTKVESFPAKYLATQFGFRQAEYFELEDVRHTSPPPEGI